MSGYVKLFGSLLDSTVWETPLHTKVVWITLLAMADRDGLVEAAIPGLAKRAGVTRAQCEEALSVFLAPDPDSRTKEHEGRRIEVHGEGWRLLNYEKYREKATKEEKRVRDAERQKRKYDRDKKKAANLTETHAVSPTSPAASEPRLSDPSASPQAQASSAQPRAASAPARAHAGNGAKAASVQPADVDSAEAEIDRLQAEHDARDGERINEQELDEERLALEASEALDYLTSQYTSRYIAKLTNPPPTTKSGQDALLQTARWLAETARIRKIGVAALTDRLLDGFFASTKAKQAKYRATWLQTDPTEFLPAASAAAAISKPPELPPPFDPRSLERP